MAEQLAFLPDSGVRTIVDDGRGHIVYYRKVFDALEAQRYFDLLREKLPWKHETMRMYGKRVAVPRLTASASIAAVGPEFVELKRRVEALAGVRFNSMSANYYRDGQDSVAWHNDHEEELAPFPSIALVSFGAVREMLLRRKDRRRNVIGCDLEPGSVLLMDGSTQHFWEHHVPKSTRTIGPRVSVALRQRRTAPENRE